MQPDSDFGTDIESLDASIGYINLITSAPLN